MGVVSFMTQVLYPVGKYIIFLLSTHYISKHIKSSQMYLEDLYFVTATYGISSPTFDILQHCKYLAH
jgi:hypothetical protein